MWRWLKNLFREETSIELVEDDQHHLAMVARDCHDLLMYVAHQQSVHRAWGEELTEIRLSAKAWPTEYELCRQHNIGSMNGVRLEWVVKEETIGEH